MHLLTCNTGCSFLFSSILMFIMHVNVAATRGVGRGLATFVTRLPHCSKFRLCLLCLPPLMFEDAQTGGEQCKEGSTPLSPVALSAQSCDHMVAQYPNFWVFT